MTAPTQPPTTVDLLVVLTRVETKLDAAAIQGADHEARIRALEKSSAVGSDHDTRIAALESSRWPLPAIGALTGIAGTIAASVALFR